MSVPFWQSTALAAMDEVQWESLCDGCGRCCLLKLEYEDTGEVCHTSVACRLLDIESCRCRDYTQRSQLIPECVRVTPDNIADLYWLPETCAYRRLYHGEPLPDWHHLVCGDSSAVHDTAVSVKWFAVSEDYVHAEQLEDFVIEQSIE